MPNIAYPILGLSLLTKEQPVKTA